MSSRWEGEREGKEEGVRWWCVCSVSLSCFLGGKI